MTTTADPADEPAFAATALRLLRFVRVHRAFTLMFVLGLTSIATNVLGPFLLGRVTNLLVAGVFGRTSQAGTSKAQVIAGLRAQGHGGLAGILQATDFVPGHGVDLGAVARILIIVLVIYAVSGLCWSAQGWQATRAIQHAASRLRTEVDAKLARLPLSRFDTTRRGELLSRATNDIDNLVQSLQQTMSQLTNSVLLIIGLLAVMFWMSPLLAIIAVVVVPVAVFVTTRLGKRAQPQFAAQWAATGRLTAQVEESYGGHAVIAAHDQRAAAVAEFRTHNEQLFRSAFRAQFVSGSSQPVMNFVNNLGYVLVAAIGCLRVLSGALSIGELQAFIQYSRQLSGPLTQVTSLASVVQSGIASARRVFELLDSPEESSAGQDAALASPVRGLVRFEDVHFRYQPDTPLLDGVSLTARPGALVAIVGETGAGKTTLVNLLLRFYEPSAGRITLDGVDIATLPRETLRSTIGMVLQDTWLFTGSIADNIGYGRENATRSDIEAAARAAHADHLIRTLPGGYDTIVDGENTAVSAGERQLITIARAFLSDPPILVLDEATSSVDTRTEVLVRKAMRELSAGRTSFVIAHRLSTIRDADTILVMSQGNIVELGTHDELLAANGAYARLYHAQFALPAEAD